MTESMTDRQKKARMAGVMVNRRYPDECPTCGMFLHQSHAEIYGECVLCGGKVRPKDQETTLHDE